MAKLGALINMQVKWRCFSPVFRKFDICSDCELDHSFVRMDNPYTSNLVTRSERFAEVIKEPSLQTRTHVRSYRFQIEVNVDHNYTIMTSSSLFH